MENIIFMGLCVLWLKHYCCETIGNIFHFYCRYGFTVSRLKRSRSEDSLSSGEFRARPFPKDIFTDFAYEKMKEDLAFRNVRKTIRQKEMLAAARYPQRMAESIQQTTTRRKTLKKQKVTCNLSKVKCHKMTFS